jgi:hypothetical protein
MATTKFSVSAYTADGVTTDYLITWDYLDQDHIAVYVDGTPNYDPSSTYKFELINSTTVRVTDEFDNPVPSGSEIEVRRETPILNRSVDFVDGSSLLAEDLNKNSDYLLYSMQEVLDTVEAAAQDGALAAQVATEALRDESIILRDTTLGYKNEAQAARDTTQTYLATVDADATAADNHRIAAAASEAAAATSEADAAASQAASAASEAAAAASEAASAASETAAAASAAAALASQNAAATSETNAAASETAAQVAQNAAELALDELTDLYLGAKSFVPDTDNDGNPLVVGALYWNSVSDIMYVWNGTAWDTFNSTTGIADGATSAKVTLTDTELTTDVPVTLNGNNFFTATNYIVRPRADEPANPVLGQLWFDQNSNMMKHWNGTKWIDMSNLFVATGGNLIQTYSTGGDTFKVHTFTSSGVFTVQSGNSSIDALIVAGGGSGGAHACPAGGGAGGLVYKSGISVFGGDYNIIVGAGGPRTFSQNSPYGYQTGYQGANSSAFGLTAIGGGGGATWDGEGSFGRITGGSTGGYGQGGSINSGVPTAQQPIQAGDSGLYGYGNRGGDGVYYSTPYPGGGGGGAGGVGENSPNGSTAGRGGIGFYTEIRGTGEHFASGGCGGGWGRVTHNAPYAGGGAIGDSGDASGQGTSWRGFGGYSQGADGSVNTGGGGGGAGRTGNELSVGGAGGSGIVIIRYKV